MKPAWRSSDSVLALPAGSSHRRRPAPTRRFLPAKLRAFLEALRDYFGDDPNADIWWSRDRTQS
ncbi:MAG: hypothetical protein ACXVDD_28410 [Polyangia bacterium]